MRQYQSILTIFFVLAAICVDSSVSTVLGASSKRLGSHVQNYLSLNVWESHHFNRLVRNTQRNKDVHSNTHTSIERSQMDDVIIQLLNGFKANMTTGFPDLGIPILDPLKVEHIPLNISEPMLSLNGSISNLDVIGLSGFKVVNVSSEFPRIAIDIELLFPSLELSGEYDVKGKAADVLPIYGSGSFHVNITGLNLRVMCRLKVKAVGRLSMDEIDYKIKIQKIKVAIGGLMGGGELGQTFNDMINTHGITLSSILGSGGGFPQGISTNIPTGLPSVWSKSGFPITRADASEYVDYTLANLREFMIFNGLDRIPLENKTEEFSETFIGITWYGKASLYNGVLAGLETIHRSGSANLNLESGDIVFDAQLEVNDAGLKYSMLAKFMGLGPTATAIGSLESIKVFVKCRVSSGLNNVTLDEFKVLDLGHLSIDIQGLGPLGFVVGVVADLIGNSLKGVVADMLEGTIKSMLNEIIGEVLFPLNANNAIKNAPSALHPYRRMYVARAVNKLI